MRHHSGHRAVRRAIACACLSLVACIAVAGAYRYKDANGQWVYTDRPPAAERQPESMALAGGAVSSPRIVIEPRSTPEGVALVAVNECPCAVEFGIFADAEGGRRSARGVVAPHSERVLLDFAAVAGPSEIAFEYGYVIGAPGATHAPSRPYRAPFALAQSFPVTQAPPDALTHKDLASRNAIDIAMPVGTAVHAAREGVVINVAEANFVQVLHDDDTNAIYAHLQMDTVRVRPGQRIARGEYIANSGNTGYSSGPHLHFVVLRNVGLRSESLPVLFAGQGGSSLPAQSGKPLTAY
jgi:murein DD-endopeptidase MepM/ murein hydrolase activator NlpD